MERIQDRPDLRRSGAGVVSVDKNAYRLRVQQRKRTRADISRINILEKQIASQNSELTEIKNMLKGLLDK